MYSDGLLEATQRYALVPNKATRVFVILINVILRFVGNLIK